MLIGLLQWAGNCAKDDSAHWIGSVMGHCEKEGEDAEAFIKVSFLGKEDVQEENFQAYSCAKSQE